MDLKPLFEPKSLAVVGVSLHNDLHPSNIIFYKNLYRYPVEAYPVNPKAGILKGVSAYPSVKDLPVVVDLAIVSARAEAVPGILQDCVEAGVKGAAIISGGFSEVGNRDLQNEIVSIAKEADFPLSGRTAWASIHLRTMTASSSRPSASASPGREMWRSSARAAVFWWIR